MDNDKILELIEKELSKTREQLDEYQDMAQPISPDNAIGRVSRMDAINNKSITEAAIRNAEEKLKALKYVKTRVGEKDFGKCARCGEEIHIKRILLRPQSIHCVKCAR